MTTPDLLPPPEMIERVGCDPDDPIAEYLEIGVKQRGVLESYLPPDWTWEGKTYLDWGAGAGRLVRQFLPEARSGTRVIGSDIDEPSIDWLAQHLAPIEGLVVGHEAGIALPDNSVDVVTAFSVFTHVTDHWAPWLLELRRVLRPGGVMLASTCGEAMTEYLLGKHVGEDDFGILVTRYGQTWEFGGPMVMASPWWIRAHWGRAFTISKLDVAPWQVGDSAHDLVLAEKPAGPAPSVAALEELADDPREIRALETALRSARSELIEMRESTNEVARAHRDLQKQAEHVQNEIEKIYATRSWRVTAPLRARRKK